MQTFQAGELQSVVDRHAQLDGLRAIAMCGVLYVHLFETNPATEDLRVSLFFIISGFLITHVLCLAKDSGNVLHIGSFYMRRALRLFPALIVFVAVAAAGDMDGFRTSALWHLAQLSNIYFALTQPIGPWQPWVAGHLWSLNVVEQFYLVVPFLVIFLRRRHLLIIAASIWIAAVFARVNAEHLGVASDFIWNVLCYDPIFAGVIARLLLFDARLASVARARRGTIFALAVLASPLVLWADFGHSESYRLLVQPALALIVMQAYLGFCGPVGAILGSRTARFFAQISYGVYMYHLAIWWVFATIDPVLFTPGVTALVVVSAVSVIAATLSFYLVERPVSRLKRHFPIAAARCNPAGHVAGLGPAAASLPAPANLRAP